MAHRRCCPIAGSRFKVSRSHLWIGLVLMQGRLRSTEPANYGLIDQSFRTAKLPRDKMAAASKTLVYAMTMIALIQLAAGASFNVGGDYGAWDLNINLQEWASSQLFKSGDSLSFAYMSSHSVLEVSKADFDLCETGNSMQAFIGGSTIVKLSTAGKRYFICGVPGHCSLGMKVEIDTASTAVSAPTQSPRHRPMPAMSPPPPAKPRSKSSRRKPPPAAVAPTKAPSSSSPLAQPIIAPSKVPSMSPLAELTAPTPQASASSDFALWLGQWLV